VLKRHPAKVLKAVAEWTIDRQWGYEMKIIKKKEEEQVEGEGQDEGIHTY
jgi:hypothetical protein